jgi:hypothetical protein
MVSVARVYRGLSIYCTSHIILEYIPVLPPTQLNTQHHPSFTIRIIFIIFVAFVNIHTIIKFQVVLRVMALVAIVCLRQVRISFAPSHIRPTKIRVFHSMKTVCKSSNSPRINKVIQITVQLSNHSRLLVDADEDPKVLKVN